MIKAVIIDDEQHSIDTLRWKLENYCPDVTLMAAFDNPSEGVAYLKTDPPDLVFLDIEMPLLTGFEVLEELGKNTNIGIIFTTAYDQFGIQAVKSGALDYLLKPIQNKELKEAIDKYRVKAGQPTILPAGVQPDPVKKIKVPLASKESIEFVDPQDIIICIASSNYTTVYLSDGRKRVLSKTLKEFEEMLAPHFFFRPHHSHLVNLKYVSEFMRGDGGYLVMQNKMKVPVSKNRKEELMNLLV
jgi:two-component system, LytTR family, response regulator